MKVKDKKQYLAPRLVAATVEPRALMVGSTLTAGGDNDQPGAPTEAESKAFWGFPKEWAWNEEQE